MKLKSLLIGSAAALVATGGAQAADVMMEEEMEPVEYVRVCDAYGAGFFYIPGSETCLRFEGYARYQINVDEDYLTNSHRFRLNVDARSDTDWGTLRGFGRIQATGGDSSDASFAADQLMVQLSGFHLGYSESAFVAPWGGPGIARFGVLHTDGGGSYAKGGYDESASEATVMAGIHINVPDAPGSSFRAGVFYATGENDYAPDAPVTEDDTEWSVAASYKHQFTPAFSGVLGGQYFEDFHGDNSFLIQGAVVRVPVADQAEIRLESAYEDHDAADDGEWSGFLRFRRYF